MKKTNWTYIFYGILTLILISSCKTNISKTDNKSELPKQQNFTNKSRIPLISNCKDNHIEACLQNTISDLILKEVEKRNLTLKTDAKSWNPF